MKRGSFDKLLHSQGSAPTFDGLPVDNIPSFYKAENQKPTEVSIALFKASSDGNIEEIRHALLQVLLWQKSNLFRGQLLFNFTK